MIFKTEKYGHLTLRTIEDISVTYENQVLIIGNAYGIMPYIEPLAKELFSIGYKPYWFAFSGQDNTSGNYSYLDCSNDIKMAVNAIKEKRSYLPINIIAHCAGSLMVLEYMKKYEGNPIEKLIIYGLLFNPSRRRRIAEKLLKINSVNYALTESDWKKNPLEYFKGLKLPILFCHATDKVNLERANLTEINMAVQAADRSKLHWFEEGYDKNIKNISQYIHHYDSFFKENKSI